MVDLRRRLVAAVQHRAAVQILAFLRGETHQPELLGHAVLCDHRTRDGRRLLDVVGGTRRHSIEDDLLGRPSAQRHHKPGLQLLLRAEEFFLLRNLHDVAERAHRAGNDRDFLNRLRVFLKSGEQRVPHFMVRDDPAFLFSEDPVLLLLAYEYNLDRVLQILLRDSPASVFDRENRRLVDHVGKIGTDGAACGQRDGVEIHRVVHRHILRVHLENRDAAFEIRPVHNNPPVEAARTKQRGIQHLRPVRRRQNQKSLRGVKSVHFREELIQRLLPLVISAEPAAVSRLADGVNLIDEDDAGGVLLRLLKKITDPARADADKHLDKFGAGQREKRNVRLPGNRFRQQGFAGARRADQKRALRQLRADLHVAARIVQEVHHFLKALLRFILAGHVLERHAGVLLNIGFGPAFSDVHHPAAAVHAPHQNIHEHEEEDERDQEAEQCFQHSHRNAVRLLFKGDARLLQPGRQRGDILRPRRVVLHNHR